MDSDQKLRFLDYLWKKFTKVTLAQLGSALQVDFNSTQTINLIIDMKEIEDELSRILDLHVNLIVRK